MQLLRFLLFLTLPGLAHAHGGGGASWWQGLAHPLGGADHLLAMLAVGLWAGQIGGAARWQVPASFLLLMACGAALGLLGLALPLVEEGILASGLVLGLLLAGALRWPDPCAAALVGLFALWHGQAHGSEMPAELALLPFALGFLVATALLHLTGLALAQRLQELRRPGLLRLAGGAIVLAELWLWRA